MKMVARPAQHAILPSTYFPGISGRTMDRDRNRKWKKAGRRVEGGLIER
jgi:hypothetical protein